MKTCFDYVLASKFSLKHKSEETTQGEQKCLKKMAHMIETLSMCELHGDFFNTNYLSRTQAAANFPKR